MAVLEGRHSQCHEDEESQNAEEHQGLYNSASTCEEDRYKCDEHFAELNHDFPIIRAWVVAVVKEAEFLLGFVLI